ncbi:MAG TPA: hypothetical protein VGJ21_19890 [Terracidiphilus sp.]
MSDIHSRIIATAAKAELASLGFRQSGRSRLWVADRGSWLNVVEFTPSRWSKSVDLTNAAHWLWVGAGFMSLNEAFRSGRSADFETEDQFRSAVSKIAESARENALVIEERFSSFSAIADFVVERAQSSPDRMGTSWWGYEAGIASGLLGKLEEARRFLQGVSDERVADRAVSLLSLLVDPKAFKSKVNEIVVQQRATLKLKPLDGPAF